jgi:hypothetical protein
VRFPCDNEVKKMLIYRIQCAQRRGTDRPECPSTATDYGHPDFSLNQRSTIVPFVRILDSVNVHLLDAGKYFLDNVQHRSGHLQFLICHDGDLNDVS